MDKKLIQKKIYTNDIAEDKEYKTDHLNWRDDGDSLSDPAMNDFLKGYNINPYEFQQWASKKYKNKYVQAMKKQASGEVFVMQFSPEFLADRILTLWNGADGPLQNFFEAFTLRYNNALKQQVAAQLAKQGYQVYPCLIDDKPRYASKKLIPAKYNRLLKLMNKVAKTKNINNIIHLATQISHSDNLQLFAGELADKREYGKPVNLAEAKGILQYYQNCFPEDYALKLVSGLMNSQTRQFVDFTKFNDTDWDISDESLARIESYMSGNNDSYTRSGGTEGWNFTTDMRNFDGTRPTRYEISAKRLIKKHKKYAKRMDMRKKK